MTANIFGKSPLMTSKQWFKSIIALGQGNRAPPNYYNTSLHRIGVGTRESRIFRYYYWSARTDIKVVERPLSMFTPVHPKNHEITDNRRKRPPRGGDALLTSSAIYNHSLFSDILLQRISLCKFSVFFS